MTIHSISDLRKAQVFVKDLEKAIKIIEATQAALKGYEKYRPVHHILTTINTEKAYLEIFLEQNKAIIESKGKRYK